MTNPIQTVLNAEAEAQQKIEAEEKAALTGATEARQQARKIIQRNETRTVRVSKRYEAFCERDLMSKIDTLVDESEKELEQFSHLSKVDRKSIVDAVLELLSPPSAGKAGKQV